MTQSHDSTASAVWYYLNAENEATGPFTLQELQSHAAAGSISPETLVAQSGSSDWMPYSSLIPSKVGNTAPPPPLPSQTAQKALKGGKGEEPRNQRAMLFILIGLVFVLLMALPGLLGRGSNRSDDSSNSKPASSKANPAAETVNPASESLEYKLACIDAGYAVSKSSPELKEYKRVMEVLADRFDITSNRVGEMAHAVSNHLKDSSQIQATSLEMMHAAEKATSGDKVLMVGKGEKGLSSTFATLATLMVAEKK